MKQLLSVYSLQYYHFLFVRLSLRIPLEHINAVATRNRFGVVNVCVRRTIDSVLRASVTLCEAISKVAKQKLHCILLLLFSFFFSLVFSFRVSFSLYAHTYSRWQNLCVLKWRRRSSKRNEWVILDTFHSSDIVVHIEIWYASFWLCQVLVFPAEETKSHRPIVSVFASPRVNFASFIGWSFWLFASAVAIRCFSFILHSSRRNWRNLIRTRLSVHLTNLLHFSSLTSSKFCEMRRK